MLAVVATVTVGVLPVLADSQQQMQQCYFYNYYARAVSGYGNGDNGTAAAFQTPPNGGWSAPSPSGFSDEAAWLMNDNNTGNAIEGGYYTGAGAPGVPFTTGLVPYYTLNNGNPEVDDSGKYLSPATNYTMYVVNGGHLTVGPYTMSFSYSVSQPQLNFHQGETNTTAAWMMNGGTGETYTNYWSPNGSNWYLWGFNNDCSNSPYWTNHVSASAYKNGGW